MIIRNSHQIQGCNWLKVKGWEKICPANNQKAVEMAIFITHKMTLKQRKLSDIKRDIP